MSRIWSPQEVLPHRLPMQLITRIVSWGSRDLVAEVDIAEDGLFTEAGLGVPRWVGLEYMAQAVAALDGIRLREVGRDVPPGYLLGTRRLEETDGYFRPGETLRITVQEVLQGENGLGVFSCLLWAGERSLSCQLTVYKPRPSPPEPNV